MAKKAIFINEAGYVTTIYTANSPATCTVGGISPGYVLTGKTIECILQDAIAPYVEPAFSSFAVNITSPMEVGAALSGTKTFSWVTSTCDNVASNSIGILNTSCGTVLQTGLANDYSEELSIGTMDNSIPDTWTWQITGCSTQDTAFNRNVSKCSVYPIYYGKLTSGSRPTPDNTLITTGCIAKPAVNSTGTVTVTFSSAANEYTWLAIPSTSTSKTCWYVNALDNGLINDSPSDKYPDEQVVSVTSAEGCWSSINYKVYMSGAVGEISAAMQFRNS
jgi:hypothetical protein